MGYVTTWIGNTEVEVSDQSVLEYMEFFLCSYDDALFGVACDELGLTAKQKVELIIGKDFEQYGK